MRKITAFLFFLSVGYYSPAQNVGIGVNNPVNARLEIQGRVGATVAMFGSDAFGVGISANNPEIGFNYFFNNGSKTIRTGYAGLFGMNPANGEIYIGNFNGNQSTSNFGSINGYRQNITLFQDGEFRITGTENVTHFYYGANEDTYVRGGKAGSHLILNDVLNGNVGINTYPTHAKLEVSGYVGGVFGGPAAIFGNDATSGVSVGVFVPSIGFNHYFDGFNKTLQQGYASSITMDITSGDLYFVNFNSNQSSGSYGTINGYSRRMVVKQNGNVGIGTDNPTYKLSVNGNIRSKEVVVESGWADYVFDKEYKLPSLYALEKFIQEHKHLPNIPSAGEIETNGLMLGDTQKKMMEKIEELTLYVIELNKRLMELESVSSKKSK